MEKTEIYKIREKIFSRIMRMLVMASVPAFIIVSLNHAYKGEWIFVAFFSIILLCNIPMVVHSDRFSFKFRAFVACATVYSIGVIATANFGIFGAGLYCLLTVNVLVTSFMGLRSGIISLAACVFAVIFIGLGSGVDIFIHKSATVLNDHPLIIWAQAAFIFIMFGSVMVIAPGILQRRLLESLLANKKESERLAESNLRLKKEILERQKAEQAMLESEGKFRAAFQTSPDAIAVNRMSDGLYREINEGFLSIMGYQRDDLIGCSSLELNIWKNIEDRERMVKALKDHGYMENLEAQFVRKDGAIRYGLMSATTIDWSGEKNILSITRDITDLKMAEEEKCKLEEQFHQAQKMETVGRLAGGVAHDFNNLLTGISGNVSLIKMDLSPTSSTYDDLNEIGSAADRAKELTSQLLAFSRKQVIHPKVINLNDLITNMHKMLCRIIGEDVDIETIPTKNLGQIKADPGQIEQIIVNLSVNARDALPKGGKIVIETSEVNLGEGYCKIYPNVKPGNYVMLAISDNGEGMDEETQKKIFDPFFTTKAEGQGTGLGLATVYGIIKQHNGHVKVYSEVKQGTVVKAYFPLVQEKAQRIRHKAPGKTLPKGDETVFVVEDDKAVRNIAIKILTRLGYNVISADNGFNAIEMMDKNNLSIDLLFTDVLMPIINGRELADKVLEKYPDTKVLFTSGYTENIIANHDVLAPEVEFISKPYSTEALSFKVRQVLDKVTQKFN